MINFVDKVKLPSGKFEKLDKLEKLYIIAKERNKHNTVQFAMVGKPSAPVYQPIVDAEVEYWQQLDKSCPITYGELQGEECYRVRMANALSAQYNVPVEKEHIMFTSGGRMAIQAVTHLIRSICSEKLVVTTSLYYPDHTGVSYSNDHPHSLLLVDVEKDMGSLTSNNLMQALDGIDKDKIGAFVFSDPNNPMGNVVGKEEWLKIIPILEQYENSIILLDEAYAEMVFDALHQSLYSMATQRLRKQIILLRSGTKGFSVSGERMAVLVSSNSDYISKIVEYHSANLIHTPKSAQYAYTNAMEQFNGDEQLKLASFYKPMVRKVEQLLIETEFNVKQHVDVKRSATFYVVADFSLLYGAKLPQNLLDLYESDTKKHVENNIDLAMYILFKYGLALMPMYFFGAKLNSGLVRVTCSFESDQEFTSLASTLTNIAREHSSNQLELV